MISLSETMPSLTAHIARMAQRLGFGPSSSRGVQERAGSLSLPFTPLAEPEPSIFWEDGPCLHRLVELPRGALSGPVQEDKARAHAALCRLIRKDSEALSALDLRQVDGVCARSSEGGERYPSFEAFAASGGARRIRIISYKDFLRVIGTAIPGYPAGAPVELRQASWLGERLYWSSDHHADAFACAIAYARLRGLEVSAPVTLTDYRLERSGVRALDEEYHALAMPAQAWSDKAFMAMLLDSQVPYARLSLLRQAGNSELLLLERRQPTANALGEGLKAAGAPDFIRYLKGLPQITRFKRGEPLPEI
ncbi:MAG: DUF6685 family protein [Pseudomonadota bacterium]